MPRHLPAAPRHGRLDRHRSARVARDSAGRGGPGRAAHESRPAVRRSSARPGLPAPSGPDPSARVSSGESSTRQFPAAGVPTMGGLRSRRTLPWRLIWPTRAPLRGTATISRSLHGDPSPATGQRHLSRLSRQERPSPRTSRPRRRVGHSARVQNQPEGRARRRTGVHEVTTEHTSATVEASSKSWPSQQVDLRPACRRRASRRLHVGRYDDDQAPAPFACRCRALVS